MRNGSVDTVQELTKDHALAEKALRLPLGATAVGYTSPYLSLSDLMKKWPETADRREILMITSGIDPLGGGFSDDPYNNPYLKEAFDRAQRGGVYRSAPFTLPDQAFPAAVFAPNFSNPAWICLLTKPAEKPTTSASALQLTLLRTWTT